jgi:hypothetical protein
MAFRSARDESPIPSPPLYLGPVHCSTVDSIHLDGPIATAWNVRGWPTLYILDHNGVIRYKNFVRADLGKLVDNLLKEVEINSP